MTPKPSKTAELKAQIAKLEAQLHVYESKYSEHHALRRLAIAEAMNEERGAEIARLRDELAKIRNNKGDQ